MSHKKEQAGDVTGKMSPSRMTTCRNLYFIAAICLALASLAVIAAACISNWSMESVGKLIVLIGLCFLSIRMAKIRATQRTSSKRNV